MDLHSLEPYQYDELLSSFRLLELLPGQKDEPVCCRLTTVEWRDRPVYEALSYTWGDRSVTVPLKCNEKRLDVTTNLHAALLHLRTQHGPRTLWVDAVCTNQRNIPERGIQVSQMRQIYEKAQSVIVWLGPDSEAALAGCAAAALITVSDAICEKLEVTLSELDSYPDLYNDYIFKNRERLPDPEKISLDSPSSVWESLNWLYSNAYFSRVWVIQEINANESRSIYCGTQLLDWTRLQLVAGYLVAESAWSKRYGFSKSYCWWVGRLTASGFSRTKNWLQMMYLASNFSCSDSRDQIYGLRGLFNSEKGSALLHPDYSKSVLEVYRNTVEAAFLQSENTDVLLYTPGTQMGSSWVPEWNKPMLFRNPFRFGKRPPWKPMGDTKAIWKIDRETNTLHLSGVILDTIKAAEPYNENYFCNSKMETAESRGSLAKEWIRIFETTGAASPSQANAAVSTSLSFGLDPNADLANESILEGNFSLYLKAVAQDSPADQRALFGEYMPRRSWPGSDANAFGKPVWDFDYPTSTIFATQKHELIGCSTAVNRPGDLVFLPFGCTYPLILRPLERDSEGDEQFYRLEGFAYVYGVMMGVEKAVPSAARDAFEEAEELTVKIR
ncbi:hypothetical protein K402DRAFT_340114 [Aulographum hederae CBS 113979]|uniref:Heterokaryon incompatibility domain-containing protein n=1 Tax=Aulographum hederae CBS 113979 TaxID=1176131 RepID=A0A6G1GP42_9PEZI|nr:hypothetical protein K402DRAFT_340114 [Aulographum hederae CBS 113979]